MPVLFSDIYNFCVKAEFRAVCISIFSQSGVQLERADHPCGRRIQGGVYIFGNVWLQCLHLFTVQDLETFYSVRDAPVIERLQSGHFTFFQAHYKSSVPNKSEIQIFRKLLHHFVSPEIQLRHERSCRRVKSGVDQSTVGF